MTTRTRRIFAWIAAACVVGGVGLAPRGRADDGLIMVVNGARITDADVDTLLRINFGPTFSDLSPEEQETVRITKGTQTRAQVLDRVLLVTAAQATGQAVTDAEVDRQVEEMKRSLPPEMTPDDYLKGTGLTEMAFRRHAREQALIDKLSGFKTRHILAPTKAEIEAYYRRNPDYFKRPERARVRHVLISTSDAISDEQRAGKRAEAEIVRRKLLAAPEAFATLAGQLSHCPSKEQGGDLGIIEKGAMVPAFDRAVFSQKVGAIGGVIRTPKGYHIIKVEERIPAENLTLADAEDDIAAMLDFKARDDFMQDYLKQLRLSANVEKPEPEQSPPPEGTGTQPNR